MDNLDLNKYHMPHVCEKCGGVMVFKGVGEYQCEQCGEVAFDDYGKVRLYVEQHPGATVVETEAATGVSRRIIRQLLRDDRLEVAADSRAFLTCQSCGVMIRSGNFCPQCEEKRRKRMEEFRHKSMTEGMQGLGVNDIAAQQGAKRFTRDK